MKIERIKQIYDAIQGYDITLASQPPGTRYLHDQIATCRNYLNSVSLFLLEIHREKHLLAGDLSGEEAIYSIESNEMLSQDDRVRRLPSIEDRKAAIAVLLRDRVRKIAELKRQIQDLDYIEKAVRHRHRELTATMAAIKLQRSLIRDELDTQSFYGDERVQGGSGGLPTDNGLDSEEIAKLMAEDVEVQQAMAETAKIAQTNVKVEVKHQAEPPEQIDPQEDDISSAAIESSDPIEAIPETLPASKVEPMESSPAPSLDPPSQEDPPPVVVNSGETLPVVVSDLAVDEQAIEEFLSEGQPTQKSSDDDDFSDIFDRL